MKEESFKRLKGKLLEMKKGKKEQNLTMDKIKDYDIQKKEISKKKTFAGYQYEQFRKINKIMKT